MVNGEASIYTRSLGVVFFEAARLSSSIFRDTDPLLLEALKNRPVVSYLIESSPAYCAGIQLGFILTKVNGVSVDTPDDALKQIYNLSTRPIFLLFYIPKTRISISEGIYYFYCKSKCMIHVPLKPSEWKSKYIVIGGVISKDFYMNIFRSKADYDIAVIELYSQNHDTSIKVNQFCLKRIEVLSQDNYWNEYNDEDNGYQPFIRTINYQMESYYYFVIIPSKGYPIKIASKNIFHLQSLLDGIRNANAS